MPLARGMGAPIVEANASISTDQKFIKKELWSEGKIQPRYLACSEKLKCLERVLELLAEGIPPAAS